MKCQDWDALATYITDLDAFELVFALLFFRFCTNSTLPLVVYS